MKKLLLTLALIPIAIGTSLFTFCDAQHSVLLNFNDTNGRQPWGNLTPLKNKLYGMTSLGGANGVGCIFSIDTTGGGYKDLFDFTGANGSNPKGSLIISGKKMYGMTSAGGANNDGRIFSIDTNGIGYANLLDFTGGNGNQPWGSLILSKDKLYGMTSAGGANAAGNIFFIDTNGAGYTDLLDFDTANGKTPYGSLILSGHKLYGMTYRGGANDSGCIFSIDTNSGAAYTDLFDFTGSKGYYPHGDLTLSGHKLFGMTWIGGANNWGVVFSIDTNGGNSYKDLLDFDYTNGGQPQGNLTLSANGSSVYGMTFDGGNNTDGVIFKLDTNGGGYKDLFNFIGANGTLPYGSITLSGRNLYGMTAFGGANTYGVIFGCDTAGGGSASVADITATNGNITIYPNPGNGIFKLGIRNYESGIKDVEVYNLLGQRIYSQPLIPNSQFLIDLSSQPNGVYLYRLIGDTENLIGAGKLVIQK